MPENRGYYEKYRIERTDGKPITSRTFVLEVDRDPFALAALGAYRAAAAQAGGYSELVAALDAILDGEA